MASPPPNNPNPEKCSNDTQSNSATQFQDQSSSPYNIPDWSGTPCHRFYFQVHEDGSIVDQFDVCNQEAYMFGREDLCDFVLDHPTISPFHAVIQFKGSGDAYLYDVGSTHGTSINQREVEKRVYVDLHIGDIIHFGQLSRSYIFQGPSEVMLPIADTKKESDLTRANESQSVETAGILLDNRDAIMNQMEDKKQEADPEARDELVESLNDLFTSVSTMVKSELQGTNSTLELLEKMNLRVAEEYKGFGDVASGLRVFVEQLKLKSGSFDEYVEQIDAIEEQVTQFEVVISMLDKHVSLLESKIQNVHHHTPS